MTQATATPPATVPADGDRFIEAFEAATLPAGAFHHRDHVRLTWLYLDRHPPAEVLARLGEGLRRFASANGVPNLYHETITWAYVLLIGERRAQGPAGESWEEFAGRNPDLLDWSDPVLGRYYTKELLASDLARKVFLLPDRLAVEAR
jgi:hypothetical protein